MVAGGGFLLPIAPLLWIAVYYFAAHASAIGRIAIAILVAVQCAMDAYVWQYPKTLWRDEDGSIFFPGSVWLPAWTDTGAAVQFAILVVAGVGVDDRVPATLHRIASLHARSELLLNG
jgi:hypothetical protein